jgi:hypothetical protein
VRLLTALAAAVRHGPDLDPGEMIAAGWDQLHPQLDAYLDVGLTKFVIGQTEPIAKPGTNVPGRRHDGRRYPGRGWDRYADSHNFRTKTILKFFEQASLP